jgi:DNA invertase Pin-like site-specific DNA recombinase
VSCNPFVALLAAGRFSITRRFSAASESSDTHKAFGYLRVSGRAQQDGDGYPRQRAAIEAYAAANGLKIVRWFEERMTGTADGAARPRWVEMLAAILADGVKTIVIERLDRLARDIMVQEHIVQDVQRLCVDLASTCEPDLCSNDPTRKLMRQIMGAIAEYDRCMIVLKLRAARQRKKARTGRCEGAKPYGSLPGEPDVLARMKKMRAAGAPLAHIAATLNAEGVGPRRGERWHALTVSRIVGR